MPPPTAAEQADMVDDDPDPISFLIMVAVGTCGTLQRAVAMGVPGAEHTLDNLRLAINAAIESRE